MPGGNIRELRNTVERAILLGKPASVSWLEPNEACDTSEASPCGHGQGYPSHWRLKEVERAHIEKVVESHQGNKSAAARQLGVARKTLERKFRDWG